jgi:hypothetical protein
VPERKVLEGITTRRGPDRSRRREGPSLADCVPIVGDRHWTPAAWKGGDDLGIGEGHAVMLRAELKQARIYGLEID